MGSVKVGKSFVFERVLRTFVLKRYTCAVAFSGALTRTEKRPLLSGLKRLTTSLRLHEIRRVSVIVCTGVPADG